MLLVWSLHGPQQPPELRSPVSRGPREAVTPRPAEDTHIPNPTGLTRPSVLSASEYLVRNQAHVTLRFDIVLLGIGKCPRVIRCFHPQEV